MNSPLANPLDTLVSVASGWQLDVYNEAFERPGVPRPEWRLLLAEMATLTGSELTHRAEQAERTLRENGVTFNVFSSPDRQRPWMLDPLPLMISSAEWTWMQTALDQRARLLEQVIRDLHGPQTLLRQGLLPAEVVYAQTGFLRESAVFHSGEQPSLTLYSTELARSADGVWRAMADRTDAPVGLGFVLENRIVTARLLPQVSHRVGVKRLAPFFIHLKNALSRLSPGKRERPRVVLLSPGPQFRFYFEDVYLARYLGLTLVEGGDLAVRDDRVFLKTLSGLKQVDVIFSRSMEQGIDPLEQGALANTGVPGLMQAIRMGHVRLANAPGCGLMEAPVFMAFLPALCQYFLNEPLLLPSIATWWCGNPESLELVYQRWPELVLKPAFRSSGQEEFIVSRLSASESRDLRGKVAAQPWTYIAQERIERSAAPCWREGRLQPGHVALRTFSVVDEQGHYQLMPGGLVRLAPTPEPMELSVLAGVSSKDLWIPAEGPVPMVSLLDAEHEPVVLKRSAALFPSRVADNLFWLGQSLERADFLGRLLRATVERLTSESESDLPEMTGLLRALADQGQIDASFAVTAFRDSIPRLEQVLPNQLFDPSEARGLANAVSELRRLNSSVRDWISVEMWKTTQHGIEQFQSAAEETRDLADVLDVIDRLIVDLAAISGLIHDGMIRGPAWRFLDLGRRIERGRNSASLLLSVLLTQQHAEKPMLKAILEVLDCRMTYRSRYLENVQQNGVFDLAITDETNPHSVSFQAQQIASHIEELPHDTHNPLRTQGKRLIMSIVHTLRMVTDAQLAESPPTQLESILSACEQRFKDLLDELSRRYLVLSVRPRQIKN